MDKFQKSQQHKQFNRSSDIEVSAEFKSKVEALALAHYASGNMDGYVVGMNSIAKTDAKHDLLNNVSALDAKITSLTNALGGTDNKEE